VHYLNENNIFIFLLQVFVLLLCARGLGELFRRWKQPALTAEILVGIVFGPTILGRFFPVIHQYIFPPDVIQKNMLETVAWVGILFFLLKTGLEIDFSSAWRQRGDALKISFADLTVPMAIAFVPCLFLPEKYMVDPSQRIIFALFVATIMTISALPVTARVLGDLNLYKTDIGFLIMSALSVNDLLGWVIFTLILGFFTQASIAITQIATVIIATVGFAVLCLAYGRKLADGVISKIKKTNLPEPSTSLTFICLLGILCGAITVKIGIHALFGFFIAGIMAGEARALSEKTRQVISQMVHAIFIPLFFASVGLKIDFFKNFDVFFVVFILVIGIAGRFLGAWVGVKLTGKYKPNRFLISLAHIPGGEMQIVVGLLALEYRLISEQVFVAVVFGAVISSVILGPCMSYALKKRKQINILEFFLRRGVVTELKEKDKKGIISELCGIVAEQENMPGKDEICSAVMNRENDAGTALEKGVAIPHARMDGITNPVVAFGKTHAAVDWDSPDGEPTHFIFLILSPKEDAGLQLQILRAISIVMSDKIFRNSILDIEDRQDLWAALQETFTAHNITRK
jgi:Kef-type K+ transport system membrane component KefB/mannitol/fructose-specific phosphotransferase system IIA component (Ntr-type)